MREASQTYAMLFKLAVESQETERIKSASALTPGAHLMEFLRNPKIAWGLGATGLGAAGLGIPLAYSAGEDAGLAEGDTRRNLAFGGGLLSGLVAPSVLQGLSQMVGMNLTPGTGY